MAAHEPSFCSTLVPIGHDRQPVEVALAHVPHVAWHNAHSDPLINWPAGHVLSSVHILVVAANLYRPGMQVEHSDAPAQVSQLDSQAVHVALLRYALGAAHEEQALAVPAVQAAHEK